MNETQATFSSNEKSAIVALLLDMANADGHIEFSELVCSNYIMSRLGVTDDEFALARNLKSAYAIEIARQMSNDHKIVLARLLVEIIDADEQVSDSELQLLNSIAEAIELDIKS